MQIVLCRRLPVELDFIEEIEDFRFEIEDPGSNPGPGENFSLKLTTQGLPHGYSESLILINYYIAGFAQK